ncbi:hypothetical protein Tco_0278111 [Tanacetum coccineum]
MKRLFKIGTSAHVVSSEDEGLGDQKDASKQERKIDDIDQDAEVTLVNKTQGRSLLEVKEQIDLVKNLLSSYKLKKKNKNDLQERRLRKLKKPTFHRIIAQRKLKAEMAQESSLKRAGDELEQEKEKKQKIDDDQEEAEMKKLIKLFLMKRK